MQNISVVFFINSMFSPLINFRKVAAKSKLSQEILSFFDLIRFCRYLSEIDQRIENATYEKYAK